MRWKGLCRKIGVLHAGNLGAVDAIAGTEIDEHHGWTGLPGAVERLVCVYVGGRPVRRDARIRGRVRQRIDAAVASAIVADTHIPAEVRLSICARVAALAVFVPRTAVHRSVSTSG